ncbi:MAG: DUF2400 domain-containing protein, partial [Bacteroidia bacterium]|nr:DUF2400 domain-containing protein [Bacteroidia bacterium]
MLPKGLNKSELKEFLDQKVIYYNTVAFVDSDPIQVPHYFDLKENIEISAFLTASISWGNRKSNIKNSFEMMHRMDFSPFEFVMGHSDKDLENLKGFVHRTFNDLDLIQFTKSLRHI